MDMLKKLGNTLLVIAFIGIVIAIILSLPKACDNSYSPEVADRQKSIDSLNVLFQESESKIKSYESEIEVLNKDLVEAQNKAQISETKYFNLKRLKSKPIYVENVSDCNDTIQSIYKYAVEKDSVCIVAIHGKNEVIRVQDAIIKENDSIKKEHNFMIVNQGQEVKNLNEIIEIEQKQVRKESNIKNGYKIGFVALLIKTLFFK
jgi:hypothetical protein